MQDAEQRCADTGAVGAGFAVQKRGVFQVRKDGLDAVDFIARGRLARVETESFQVNAQCIAGLGFQRIRAKLVDAAQVQDTFKAQPFFVIADLRGAGLAGSVHATANRIQIVVDDPDKTVIDQVHIEPGHDPAIGRIQSKVHEQPV